MGIVWEISYHRFFHFFLSNEFLKKYFIMVKHNEYFWGHIINCYQIFFRKKWGILKDNEFLPSSCFIFSKNISLSFMELKKLLVPSFFLKENSYLCYLWSLDSITVPDEYKNLIFLNRKDRKKFFG